MPTNSELSVHLFLQIAVVLAACRGVGVVMRRLGQTQVVADMAAGFVLGPLLLGLLNPSVQQWLFPSTISVSSAPNATAVGHPSLAIVYAVGQLGLVLYMFSIGLGLNVGLLVRHVKHTAIMSTSGVLTPLILGGTLGFILHRKGGLFAEHVGPVGAVLFIGAACAITAFPMLARIVRETGIMHTRVGTLPLACAGLDDAVAWVLLTVVVAATAASQGVAVLALLGTAAYIAFMIVIARPQLRRFGHAVGLSWPESAALGSLMNARGLMELVLLNIGLQARIITRDLYTILGLMTVVTTLSASPLYAWVRRRLPIPADTGGGPEESSAVDGVGEPLLAHRS